MEGISDGVKEVVAGWLTRKVVWNYDCIPQIVVGDGCVGFNVDGREVGRVGLGEDGGIHGIYYSPRDQPVRAVFS